MGTLGLDHERGGGPATHQLPVAGRVPDLNQQFRVALHVDVARGQVHELHGAVGPVAIHHAERHARTDNEVLDVGGIDAGTHLEETRFPALTFPAMAGVGIHPEALVPVADLHQHVEVIRTHGARARMDLVGEDDPAGIRLGADLRGLLHEPLLTFLDQVEVVTLPESPRIPAGDLPSEGDAPEGREDLDAELDRQVEQLDQVVLRPGLDLDRRFLRHVGRNERPDARAARPGGGVNPGGAVAGNAVQGQARLVEHFPDLIRSS